MDYNPDRDFDCNKERRINMHYDMNKRYKYKHDCDDCIFLGQYNEFDLYFCPNDMNKRYKHDCDDCIFLGQYNEFDLYFCPMGSQTVIARYSDEGGDYHSGLEFAKAGKIVQLVEAYNRTKEKGLFIKEIN